MESVARCTDVLGTFNDCAFQVDLNNPESSAISVKLLLPFGLQAIPQLGQYAADDLPSCPIIGLFSSFKKITKN